MWSIPFLVLTEISISVAIVLAVKLTHDEVEFIYTIYLLIINVVFLSFFFHKIISFGVEQRDKLLNILKEQDQSSKLLIRRDLELMRANEKLRALDTQKSEFISIIAHQMRTPLSAMKWTLNMLLKKELGPLTIDQDSFIAKAEESNDHMITLVEGMLLADKLDSTQNDIVKTDINISEIIDAVFYDVKAKMDSKHITVHYTPCDSVICMVKADKEKIRSVIQNLMENAVRYTKDKVDIYVQIYEKDHRLYMSFKDSGIGIPKDQQAYIFTKFYRARNASREEANGSGLGLFIVKSIIDKHGGEITFESEEGVGTTFTFYIPKS